MRGHNLAGDKGPIYKPGFSGCGNLVYERPSHAPDTADRPLLNDSGPERMGRIILRSEVGSSLPRIL